MNWWHNIPFFLIWCPLLLSSVTAVLKPRYAKKLALGLPLIGTIASAILLFFTIREGGSFGPPQTGDKVHGPETGHLRTAFDCGTYRSRPSQSALPDATTITEA